MYKIRSIAVAILLMSWLNGLALDCVSLNKGWRVKKGVELRQMTDGDAVDLPHSWNIGDAMYGGDYYRGSAIYSRIVKIPQSQSPKRYTLKVNAAQSEADVYIDNKWVGKHKGGYTAFAIDITPYVVAGKEHKLDIRINNSQTSDIAPLCGDFNIYGGLTRGVDLLISEPNCITPDFYASSGVFFRQDSVSDKRAVLNVTTLVSIVDKQSDFKVAVSLKDGQNVVCSDTVAVRDSGKVVSQIEVENPHLWDGVNNPFMYDGVVSLIKDGIVVDQRKEKIGLRYYGVDSERGFSLNGKPYRLNGANLHQDRAERGPAYRDNDFVTDMELAREMGCNSLRLSHYPHARPIYDLADRYGIVAWTEIPFVNIFVSNPDYADNLRQQLRELIYQNFNHPSILFWGLFNEVNSGWMEPVGDMVSQLHDLAKDIDSSRPTVGASNQNDEFNGYPDLIAFNKYFGWYGDSPADMAAWVDQEHLNHPERYMGISEYGAGGNIYQQSENLVHPEPWGQWHPENWQTYYHIENWKILKDRPYLWCNYIWCLCDFTAAGRKEGDTYGRNDKGMVTYDRVSKKDAFYFYKANWNKTDPVLYIAGHRGENVSSPNIDIMAFSNVGSATLKVNGKVIGKANPDEVNVITWKDVKLHEGDNEIVVTSGKHTFKCNKTYYK